MSDIHPLTQLDGHMNTYTKTKLNIIEPTTEQIQIKDIARGLAYKSHFSGQCPFYFSIAQHCFLVCDLIENQYTDANPMILMEALLHDASEAYIGDMIKPLKVLLPDFCKIEDRLQSVIFDAFEIKITHKYFIKNYDNQAQALEYGWFYGGEFCHHYIYPPDEAYYEFLRRFEIYRVLIERKKHNYGASR